nr:glucosaminidase domain-containing protein [Desulfobulbaceae bacterium]
MKNSYLYVLLRLVRLCRKFVFPAKMVLSQVAVASGSVQVLLNQNKKFKDCSSFKKFHAFLGLTCLGLIVSFVMLSGEGTSFAYRIGAPSTSSVDDALSLPFEAPVDTENDRNLILVSSADELIRELKEENLWDIDTLDSFPNVLVSRFPADLSEADVLDKKKAFIVSVLPAAMIVLNEVRQERQQLLDILDELGGNPADLIFSSSHPDWMNSLGKNNIVFVEALTRKYRTENAAELLSRVDVLPLSLIIAQGAIESSWGGSRFAYQANNLFGMWTWGKKGLVPLRRDPGKTHRIALYDSIIDSVRAYVLTINRVSAYDDLRQIRQQTRDSFSLSKGLLNYSERKELYVEDVKRVIETNNLRDYDDMSFSAT